MSFMRFLGGHGSGGSVPRPAPLDGETEAVRKIVARLESLPPADAKLLAGMAYILARVANADLVMSDVETAAMEAELAAAGLDQAQAVLVTEMAKLQERTTGETSDFSVTRQFCESATVEQRLAVLRACYHVAAADSGIGSMESGVPDEIPNELLFDREQASAVRAEFADKITARMGYRKPE